MLKEFRQPASWQEITVAAFKEEGAVGHIDHLLPPAAGVRLGALHFSIDVCIAPGGAGRPRPPGDHRPARAAG